MAEHMPGWFTEIFQDQGTGFSLAIESKVHEEKSQYQHIEIYQTKTFGKLMVLDGCVMLTDRDNFLYHEMMTHPALFTHKAPRDVAIIGGGDCGTLKEVLKHPDVRKVTQIELDERVTRVAEEHFPDLCSSNDDPRAELLFDDGIKWINDASPNSLDLIIVDSTDPVGPAEGLFAVDFYRNCHLALREGGILVQQTESPLLHADTIIKNVHADMRKAGFSTSRTLPFPQPVYPTGWWSCTMASKGGSVTFFREADAAERSFRTRYYNEDIHKGALAVPEFMKAALR